MANSMLCHSYFQAGDQAKADESFRAVLRDAPLNLKTNTIRFGIDQRVRPLGISCRILWLLGRPEQAVASAHRLLEFARELHDPIPIVMASYQAVILASWIGNWSWASEVAALMKKIATEHTIQPFPDLADSFAADVLFRTSNAQSSLHALETSFERVRLSGYDPTYHAIGLIEALTIVGRYADAKYRIDERVTYMQQNGQLVLFPEYLRLEAGILVAKGEAGAEQIYLRAIDLARAQSALAWELRATLGLAQLYRNQDPERARQTRMPVYSRFTEGLDTADLLSAKSFLSGLG